MTSVLSYGNQVVTIDAGELISFLVNEVEVIHQKGDPGWGSSDTEMFPVIGPTTQVKYQIPTPLGVAKQDQHGILRELRYTCILKQDHIATFEKTYTAETAILNSKYPLKSDQKWLSWPYDFTFTKTFVLGENGLTVSFEIKAPIGMPFMLGYHPAFKLYGDSAQINANNYNVSLQEVLDAGASAYVLKNATAIHVKSNYDLELTTKGFPHMMLWSPTTNMMCVEPITWYPYAIPQQPILNGFNTIKTETTAFSVHLKVTANKPNPNT